MLLADRAIMPNGYAIWSSRSVDGRKSRERKAAKLQSASRHGSTSDVTLSSASSTNSNTTDGYLHRRHADLLLLQYPNNLLFAEPAALNTSDSLRVGLYSLLVTFQGSTSKPSCLVPACDCVNLSSLQRRDLWDRFYTAAPRRRTLFEASYSDRKLRSRASRSGFASTRRPS